MKRNLLNCLDKRDLLNQAAVSVEALREWGDQFEANGMIHDAVDFYQKSHATEALTRMLQRAKEDGDAFLFQRISKVLKIVPSGDDWLYLAGKAEELGKQTFAAEIYRLAGKERPDKSSAVGEGE